MKKILRGHQREQTARFIAFRSHWRFGSEFCTPAEAHEKGGVEGEAGYFRRNQRVPVPHAVDIAGLNLQLLASCHDDENRMIAGRTQITSIRERDIVGFTEIYAGKDTIPIRSVSLRRLMSRSGLVGPFCRTLHPGTEGDQLINPIKRHLF